MEVESELPVTIEGNATTPLGAKVWLRVENVGALGGIIGPMQRMEMDGTLTLRVTAASNATATST